MKFSMVMLFVAMTAAMASQASADVVAYEGFTGGTLGSDASAAGVTGSGFSGYAATNFRFDIEAGLSYTDGSSNTLDVAGNSAGLTETGVGGTKNLQLTFSNTIVNTGTVYSSFLLDIGGANGFGVAAGLQDGAVGASAANGSVHEAVFRSTSSNWGILGGDNSIDVRTGPDSTPDVTGSFFVVNEYNMDTETMTTYLNPTDLSDVAGSAASTIIGTATAWNDFTHFGFGLSGGAQPTGIIDEIRIGTTMADVTPFTAAVPEPSSFVILGLCGLGMLNRRRRN